MLKFGRGILVAAGALVALSAGAAHGHDLLGLAAERNSVEPEVWSKIDEIRKLRRFLASESGKSQDAELEAVVQREMTWPDGRVSVCFLDGGREARDHVAEVALRWAEATGLQFDFGPAGNRRSCNAAGPSNVRVSFVGSGYWSYVGIEAKQVNAKQQTLNLQGMNRTSFTERDDGIILHEFGHAIGFEHEHQSPVSVCEKEFDWDYLYKAMGWSPQKVDTNMRQLQPSSKLLTTVFDADSIMLYDLDKQAFKEPGTAKCFITKPNNVISKLDREAAATVYPVVVSSLSQPVARSAAPTKRDAAVVDAIKRLRELNETPRR
jgi:astacin (peptidase family M12A)